MRFLLVIFAFLPVYLLRLDAVTKSMRLLPDDSKLQITGRISQQPYLNESQQIISVGGFLIKTGRFPGYGYGQEIEAAGKLEKKMLGLYRDQYILNYPSIKIVNKEESFVNQISPTRFLLNTRGQIEQVFNSLLPEPQSSLLSGILLGAKGQMPQNFLNNLRKTGTMHVIVASGYNITVIAGFLISFFTGAFGRRKAILFALVGIIAYTLMAGGQPAIVRAAIMGSLTYLAQLLGREKDVVITLGLAGGIMLLISPLMLFDIGFQLSFLATAGILFVSPLFKGRLFKLPILGEELKVTLSAQLGVLPIILTNFGQVSFISPLINALVLPIIPTIMSLGVLVAIFGFICQPIAQIFSWFVFLPLIYFVQVINWFGNLQFGLLTVGKISFYWVLGYYGLIALWILKNRKLSLPD